MCQLTGRIRRILSIAEGREIPKSEKLKLDGIESIRMGTTVSTNALLERQGERCALLTSEGWGDVLLIGMQGGCLPSFRPYSDWLELTPRSPTGHFRP